MAWALLAEDGTEWVLEDGEYLLGRGEECDFLTPAEDARISRVHVRLSARGKRLWVQDLASANGTRLDERPVTRVEPARPGDRLHVGDTGYQLRFAAVGERGPGSVAWLRQLPLWMGRAATLLLAVSLFLTWFEALDFDRTYLELVGDPAAWVALNDAGILLLIPLLLAVLGCLAWLSAGVETVRMRLLSGFLLGGALGVGTTWTIREQLAGWRLFGYGLDQTLGDGFTLFGWASALLLLAGVTGLAVCFLERGGLRAGPCIRHARRISGG